MDVLREYSEVIYFMKINPEERLRFIFNNINDWLKFAEAKNGSILAFNGAAIFALLSFTKKSPSIISPLLIYLLLVTFVVCILLNLITFIPILNAFFSKKNKKKQPLNFNKMNLLFYGDIAKLSSKDYLNRFYLTYYSDTKNNNSNFEKDLSNQIVNNSIITFTKMKFFKISVVVEFIGIFTFVISMLITLLICH